MDAVSAASARAPASTASARTPAGTRPQGAGERSVRRCSPPMELSSPRCDASAAGRPVPSRRRPPSPTTTASARRGSTPLTAEREPHGYDLCERHAERLRRAPGLGTRRPPGRAADRRSAGLNRRPASRLTPDARLTRARRPTTASRSDHAGVRLAAFVFCNIVRPSSSCGATGHSGTDDTDPPLWLIAVLQVPLWVGLVGAGVRRRAAATAPARLARTRFRVQPRDILVGIPIGVVVAARVRPAAVPADLLDLVDTPRRLGAGRTS